MSFNITQFVSEIVVKKDDPWYKDVLRFVELASSIIEDAWLLRAYWWGVASAMENQCTYLGGNFLVNLEGQYSRLADPTGFLGESDLSQVKFANEDQPHINDEISVEEKLETLTQRIDSVKEKMQIAGVIFVFAVRQHDSISQDLDQLTYGAIKARAANNRKARNTQVVSRTALATG